MFLRDIHRCHATHRHTKGNSQKSCTPQIVYRIATYRVNPGYRADIIGDPIILGISTVEVDCL